MQVTNEMVEAARNIINDPRMRAALEAALRARKLNDGIVSSLRVRADLRDGHMGYETLTGIACRDAADCIEEIAAALRPFASFANIIDGDPAASPTGDPCPLTLDYNRINDGCFASLGDCRRARATLEKWRLK